ncbi:MAG: hypothetical protein WCK34_09690 [Bacteroidota bacterium]
MLPDEGKSRTPARTASAPAARTVFRANSKNSSRQERRFSNLLISLSVKATGSSRPGNSCSSSSRMVFSSSRVIRLFMVQN